MAERKARNLRLIAPVTRFGHGARALAVWDTVLWRERALVVSRGWAVEFGMPCLFPGRLPPDWTHWLQSLGGQSHDVVFGVARFITALEILSHWVGTVEGSGRLIVLAPAAKRIVYRFGLKTLALDDTAMATSLLRLTNVEALVPWAEVHQGLPSGATASRRPPFIPVCLRATV